MSHHSDVPRFMLQMLRDVQNEAMPSMKEIAQNMARGLMEAAGPADTDEMKALRATEASQIDKMSGDEANAIMSAIIESAERQRAEQAKK